MKPFVNEPLSQFVDEKERKAFADAVAAVRLQFGKHYPLIIGGKALAVGNSGIINSISPSNDGDLVGTASLADSKQACVAVIAAKNAFWEWRDTPLWKRAEILRKTAAYIRDRKYEYCAWILHENGKNWRESDIEVCECIDFFEYYADQAERIMTSVVSETIPGESNEYSFQPRGVCAVIAPWNFPLAILGGMTAAAIVTGNTVVMKPSEDTPVVGAKLMEAFVAAGVPPGVINYVNGTGAEVGKALVEHPAVDIVAFTGSKSVGLQINQLAAVTLEPAWRVKRVLCEMGGKNAIVVDEDADLDEAIVGIMKSAFNYSGQKCSACSRVVAVGKVYDDLMPRLAEAVRGLKVAPSSDPSCVVNAVINEKARTKINSYIDLGRELGARMLAQAIVPAELLSKGKFVVPTLFGDVDPHSRLGQEEIFGPVLSMMRAKDFEDAMDIAIGTEFALTGSLYSRNPANIARARDRFRVGNLYINRGCTGAYVCRQPFGGFKMSGIGLKAGGPEYLLQFLEQRTITENTERRGFVPEAKK